jgi:uncharacterized membrane protein
MVTGKNTVSPVHSHHEVLSVIIVRYVWILAVVFISLCYQQLDHVHEEEKKLVTGENYKGCLFYFQSPYFQWKNNGFCSLAEVLSQLPVILLLSLAATVYSWSSLYLSGEIDSSKAVYRIRSYIIFILFFKICAIMARKNCVILREMLFSTSSL